jgi:sec-independent protein translocase protein TatA
MHSLAIIQNVGIPQLIIILVVVLIIFGPKALPQLGRSLGRGLREFRQAADKASDLLHEDEEKPAPRNREAKASLPKDPENTAAREKDVDPVEVDSQHRG